MVDILIGLGANVPGPYGPPESAIHKAIDALHERLGGLILKRSRLWRSAPVPLSDQPWYINAVTRMDTALPAQKVFETLKAIEGDFGRTMSSVRNAPRILDLDLLDYGGCVLDTPNLTLPHPRMAQRAFVLYPLAEVAPAWCHPLLHQNLQSLIEALPSGQAIEILDDSSL